VTIGSRKKCTKLCITFGTAYTNSSPTRTLIIMAVIHVSPGGTIEHHLYEVRNKANEVLLSFSHLSFANSSLTAPTLTNWDDLTKVC
jgi:hypothetical protein